MCTEHTRPMKYDPAYVLHLSFHPRGMADMCYVHSTLILALFVHPSFLHSLGFNVDGACPRHVPPVRIFF